ncbi:MAG: hypothetical protein Faunusvirus11_23 [Faunusvirus sp.]|jgi:hypothetical protein|uniref:Protein kinase domain-containing protein n=1 Tax=Faunusvirus sp. TaxID=2487766 RepID=A0A3G4ZYJ1_9VIRU|nr:MAG: hypothetical protein Faunusvirus11_23 [Faunusvirus sp.]
MDKQIIKLEKYIDGYKIVNVLKTVPDGSNIVLLVVQHNKKYVVKLLFLNKVHNVNIKKNMITEIQTYQYIDNNFADYPFFVKMNGIVDRKNIQGVILEYVTGKPLIDYKHKKMNAKWWRSLLKQLIITSYIFEQHAILHNDFWDANFIVHPISVSKQIEIYVPELGKVSINNAGFILKIFDFQYTHQYSKKSKIVSPMIMSKKMTDQNEKKRLGWHDKFHTGGDLNQILGLLSEYDSIPNKFRKYINKYVYKTSDSDFEFATQYANRHFNPQYLLKQWSLI